MNVGVAVNSLVEVQSQIVIATSKYSLLGFGVSKFKAKSKLAASLVLMY